MANVLLSNEDVSLLQKSLLRTVYRFRKSSGPDAIYSCFKPLSYHCSVLRSVSVSGSNIAACCIISSIVKQRNCLSSDDTQFWK